MLLSMKVSNEFVFFSSSREEVKRILKGEGKNIGPSGSQGVKAGHKRTTEGIMKGLE